MRHFTVTGLVSIYVLCFTAVASFTNAARVPLISRQTSSLPAVPSSCVPVCAIFNTLQTSTDPTKLCTSSTTSGLQTCANCILLIGGNTLLTNDRLLSQTQRSVNAFVSACNAASLPIPGILISDPTTQSTTTVNGTGSANSNSPGRSSASRMHGAVSLMDSGSSTIAVLLVSFGMLVSML